MGENWKGKSRLPAYQQPPFDYRRRIESVTDTGQQKAILTRRKNNE